MNTFAIIMLSLLLFGSQHLWNWFTRVAFEEDNDKITNVYIIVSFIYWMIIIFILLPILSSWIMALHPAILN